MRETFGLVALVLLSLPFTGASMTLPPEVPWWAPLAAGAILALAAALWRRSADSSDGGSGS